MPSQGRVGSSEGNSPRQEVLQTLTLVRQLKPVVRLETVQLLPHPGHARVCTGWSGFREMAWGFWDTRSPLWWRRLTGICRVDSAA